MPIRYPNFNTISINLAKPAFGYPKGATGRAYTPVIIVIHWLGEDYEGYLAQGKAPAGSVNMSQFRHPMMHYIIGQDGYAARMALPTNDAWSIMDVVDPTFTLPFPFPAISPNRYTINIGIESGVHSTMTAEFLTSPPQEITPVAWRRLVGIVGMEADRWGITPSVTTVRSHADFDQDEFSWCGDTIDYFRLATEAAAWIAAGGEPCVPQGAPACEYECGGCQQIDGANLFYSLPAGSILQVAPDGCGLVAAELPPVLDNCTIAAMIPNADPLAPQTLYIAIGANNCLVRAPLPPPLTPCTLGAQIETGTGVAFLALDGNNCMVREDDIACFIGTNVPFSPVIVPPRWVGVDEENCLLAFTPPSPLTPCDIGDQMGSAAAIQFFAVLDDNECLAYATTEEVLCHLGDFISQGAEANATTLVGLDVNNCLVATPVTTPCTLGAQINAGTALLYVGLDTNDCLVSFTPPPDVGVTPCNFGAQIGVVLDYQPEYVLALDGDNCIIAVNYPTLDGGLNPCTLGAVIPVGTITQFVGLNDTNCLVKGNLDIPPCFDFSAVTSVLLTPNLVVINPTTGCLQRINAPTYNGYLGIDSSGNYLNMQGVPLLKCNDVIPAMVLPTANARMLAVDGSNCVSAVTNGAVGQYLGINGGGQMAWQSPPTPTRCSIGALATVGVATSWLGVDGSNCLVKFTPPTLPSITPCTVGGLITGGTPTRWVGLDASNCLVFFTIPTIPTAPTACTIGALANANVNPAVKMVGLDASNCLTTSVLPLFAVTPANAGIFVTGGSSVGLKLDPSSCNGGSITANGLLIPAPHTSLIATQGTVETQTAVGVVIDTLNNTVHHQVSLSVNNPSSCRPMNVILHFSQGSLSGTMYPDQGVRRVLEIDFGGGSFAAFVEGGSCDYVNGAVSFPAPYSVNVNEPEVLPTLLNAPSDLLHHVYMDTIPAGLTRTYRMRSVLYAAGAGGAASILVMYGSRISALGVTQ